MYSQLPIRESLRSSGKLSREDQCLLVLDMATRMWSNVVEDPSKREVTLLSKTGSTVGSIYFVPEFARAILFIPTYILTFPVRLFMDRKRVDALREQTRRVSIEGLWSLIVPMAIAVLTASLLIQEVQYVRVVNGQGPSGPERNKHVVKRVVIGPGRFLFALPYHPLVSMVSYVFVLFAIH